MTDAPLHILHLTPYYAPAYAFGGVVAAVTGLAEALAARGHRVSVLSTDAGDHHSRVNAPAEEWRNGVQVLRAANRSVSLRGRLNLSTPVGMRSMARRLLADVDLLHLHEFRSVENALVIPIAAEMGLPISLSPHGTLIYETGRSRLKSAWDALISPRLVPHIGQVLALTEQEERDVAQLWARWPQQPLLQVVPNGVHTELFHTLPDADPLRQRFGLGDERIVLFMGRLHARKGLLALLKAFHQAGLPHTRLLIVGPDEGMRAQLEAMADERVVFTGYLGGAERLQAFAAADLFVLPATGEGLSMAVLEAMAAGLPLLLSPGCNLPEAEEAGAGRIVPPEAGPLAEGLRNIMLDDAQRVAMGQAARQLAATRFDWGAVAARTELAYRDLLNR